MTTARYDCAPGVRRSYLLATARLAGCVSHQPRRPSQAAGRSAGPTAPGPSSGEADHAGALESRRSDATGGAAPAHPEILKLGHRVAATTIRSGLLAVGAPNSDRRSELNWSNFPPPLPRRWLRRTS